MWLAYETRQPVAVLTDEDLAATPRIQVFQDHPFARTKRFVVAPLLVGERVIGVAMADNKPSRRTIERTIVQPFSLLCQQFASALEEARLYREAVQRRSVAEAMAQLARAIAQGAELEDVQQTIVETLSELLAATYARLHWVDEASGDIVERAKSSRAPTFNMRYPKRLGMLRSEERRVGKECRSRWAP